MNRFIFNSVLLLALCGTSMGLASEKVLYAFGGPPGDGYAPNQGLVLDKAGNFYGTTSRGGNGTGSCTGPGGGCGTVFELSPQPDGTWTEKVIYNFCDFGEGFSCPDGDTPVAGVVIDDAGNLYGTTSEGGSCYTIFGCGTVFELSPPSNPDGAWTQTVLWNFCSHGCADGAGPESALTLDDAGNLYGTTVGGGPRNKGTVFKLTLQGGGLTESVVYDFRERDDGWAPQVGVTFDKAGNLYGTTSTSSLPSGKGNIYELSPNPDGSWSETENLRFVEEWGGPAAAVKFDAAGNLYTGVSKTVGGANKGNGVLKISRKTHNEKIVALPTGEDLKADFLIDNVNRRLYGLAENGGSGNAGVAFEVDPSGQETVLYNFCTQPNCADGGYPVGGGSLVMEGGKLYGTAAGGGTSDWGVVFEIIP